MSSVDWAQSTKQPSCLPVRPMFVIAILRVWHLDRATKTPTYPHFFFFLLLCESFNSLAKPYGLFSFQYGATIFILYVYAMLWQQSSKGHHSYTKHPHRFPHFFGWFSLSLTSCKLLFVSETWRWQTALMGTFSVQTIIILIHCSMDVFCFCTSPVC